MKKILLTVCLFLLLMSPLFALSQLPLDNDDYDIAVMIVGRGAKMYAWWGHIGFVVHDNRNGSLYLYDYGNFSFEAEDFFKNYAFGRMEYLMMRMPAQRYYDVIVAQDREIHLLWLNLEPEKEVEIVDYLKWNSLPDNRTYLYHNLVNNCSTKIRDILDEHLEGQLYEFADHSEGHTIRSLARLYTKDYFIGDLLITFVHSDYTDREITLWEEMYLPVFLEKVLMDFSYTDSRGILVPMVREREVYHASGTFDPLPEKVGVRWIRGLLAGLLLAGVLLLLNCFRTEKKNWSGRLYNLIKILFSLSLAFFGSLLFFMMFFTDHDYSYGNINVVFFNPLLFAVPVLVLLERKGKKTAGKISDILFLVLGALTLLILLLQVTGIMLQDSLILLMLTIPVFTVLSGPVRNRTQGLFVKKT